MLKQKITLPIDSGGSYPNINNKSGEATKISELIKKLDRTNTGQVQWTSPTSGIVYKTSDSQDISINDKGETGLYNLLISEYSGDGGFMLTSSDMNDVEPRIEETFVPIDNSLSQLSTRQQQVATTTDVSITQMANSNDTLFDSIVSHYNNMDKSKYVVLQYTLGKSHGSSEINCGVQWTYTIPSSVLDIQTQSFEVVGYMWKERGGTQWQWGKALGVCSVVKTGNNKISYVSCYMASISTTGTDVEGYVDMYSVLPYSGTLKVLIRVSDNQ